MAKEVKEIQEVIISDLTDVVDSEKEAWLKPDIEGLSDDFMVKIKYISPDKIEEIRNKSLKPVFDTKTGQKSMQIDMKKFYFKALKEVVKDWKNMRLKDLKHLVPLKKEAFSKYPEDAIVVFNEKNLELLAEYSTTFVMWIMAILNDIDVLNNTEEELEKN